MIIKSIRTKLIIVFLLIVLISTITIGFLAINISKEALNEEISNGVLRLAEAKEGQIFAYLDSIESKTIDFSSDGFIRDSLEKINKGEDQIQIVAALNIHLKENKQSLDETITGILIADLNGKVVASTDEDEIGEDESDDSYFIEGKKGIYVTDSGSVEAEHFKTERRTMRVSAPIKDKTTGKLLGVIINFFDVQKISEILSGEFQIQKGAISGRKGATGSLEIYLVDKEKAMFIHPTEGNHNHVEDILEDIIIDTLPVQKCLDNQEEVIGPYKNFRGEKVIGASMCIASRGWVLLVEFHENEVFASINRMIGILILAIAIVVFLVVFIAVLFSNSLTKPIRKLTNIIEEISKGELGVEIPDEIKNKKDESGELARAFDRTLVSLKLAVQKTGLKKSELGLGEAIEAKEKAEEDVELFRKLMQESNDGIFIVDPKTGGLADVNKKACTALGYKREELLKMKVIDFQERFKTISDWKKHVELVKKEGSRTFMGKHKRKDGKIIPGEVNVEFIKLNHDEYFVAIVRYLSKPRK